MSSAFNPLISNSNDAGNDYQKMQLYNSFAATSYEEDPSKTAKRDSSGSDDEIPSQSNRTSKNSFQSTKDQSLVTLPDKDKKPEADQRIAIMVQNSGLGAEENNPEVMKYQISSSVDQRIAMMVKNLGLGTEENDPEAIQHPRFKKRRITIICSNMIKNYAFSIWSLSQTFGCALLFEGEKLKLSRTESYVIGGTILGVTTMIVPFVMAFFALNKENNTHHPGLACNYTGLSNPQDTDLARLSFKDINKGRHGSGKIAISRLGDRR